MDAPPGWRWAQPGIIAATTVLMLAAAVQSLDHFNPDAVAYTRIAQYWAKGDLALALNGYWGPALSWLILPLDIRAWPTFGGHMAMVVSGLLFMLACRAWFATALDDAWARALGLAMAGGVALLGSVLVISPDLLMAACGTAAAAVIARPAWRTRPWPQIGAGALLGLAYLTKAIALPFALAFVPATALALLMCRHARLRDLVRPVLVTLLTTVAVAGPWVASISALYGKPTFSTSGPIAHAIVGPGQQGEHPFHLTYYDVPPGRVTVWEEPSRQPYPYWSPLASREAMQHQLRLVRQNAAAIVTVLSAFDPLRLGLLGTMLTGLAVLLRRRDMRPDQCVVLGAAAVLPLLYLPVYTGEIRYFLLLSPMLIGVALRLAAILDTQLGPARLRLCSLVIAAAAFASVLPFGLGVIARGYADPEMVAARAIIAGLDQAGLPQGGIASVGQPWKVGLDAAFLGRMAFHGNAPHLPELDTLRRLHTQYVVVAADDTGSIAALDQGAERVLPTLPGVRLYRLDGQSR